MVINGRMDTLATTRSISSIDLMVRLGREKGLSVAQCLQGTGISTHQLEDPECRVTGAQELPFGSID